MPNEIHGPPIVRGVYPHAGADPDETARQIAALVTEIRTRAPRRLPYVQTDPETTFVFEVRVIEVVDSGGYL